MTRKSTQRPAARIGLSPLLASAAIMAVVSGPTSSRSEPNWYVVSQTSARVGAADLTLECNGRVVSCLPVYGPGAQHDVTTTSATKTSASTTAVMTGVSRETADAVAEAFGSVDLATGIMRAEAHTVGGVDHHYPPASPFVAAAGVGYADLLHFSLPSGSAPVTLSVAFDIDGAYQNQAYGGDAEFNLYMSYYNPATNHGDVLSFREQYISGTPDSVNHHFVGELTLFDDMTDVHITGSLYASAGENSYADFSHTAALSFVLPAGVTYTSESGSFLTAPGGVPEPAAWMLMIGGLGCVGAALRRRRAGPLGGPTPRSHA